MTPRGKWVRNGSRKRSQTEQGHETAHRIDATMHERAEASDAAFGEALELWKRRQR